MSILEILVLVVAVFLFLISVTWTIYQKGDVEYRKFKQSLNFEEVDND